MLYKFKSQVTGDLIMHEPNGQQILRLIGKGDVASLQKGILQHADMPAALTALELAVVHDEATRRLAEAQALAAGEPPPRAEGVALRQRAQPFIEMMKRAHVAQKDIVWGV